MKSNIIHVSDLKNKITLMKTLKINKLILLLIGLVVFNSCVEDDDFDIPNTNIEEPVLDGEIITINSVLGRLVQEQIDEGLDDNGNLNYNVNSITYQYPDDVIQYMEGYLISSDEAGNFFEELILQDRPENPTVGIKVPIEVNPLFTRYEIGRKIYVRVTGLYVGISNGVLAIGFKDGDFISQIPGPLELEIIRRSAEKADLVPLPLPLESFDNSKTNLFINIPDVQFNRVEAVEQELSFSSETFDEFDGERTLESCSSSTSQVFSTSTFADFSGLNLPTGRGNINAILSKNFFGNEFNIVINTPEGINFDDVERCDPAEFIISSDGVDCDDTFPTGNTTVFSDDFESYGNQGDLINAGWTLVNISGGSYTWGIDDFSGNTYAIGNAFNADEANIDTWLISPEINLDNTSDNVLNFDIQTNFDGGEVMSVYVSTDFVDINTDSNWSLFEDVTIPSGPSSGFGSFTAAGPVNLDCLSGTIRLGFRYTGSDPGITTRYHVDNVIVTGN